MKTDHEDAKFLVEMLEEQARHTLPQLPHELRVHTQRPQEGR